MGKPVPECPAIRGFTAASCVNGDKWELRNMCNTLAHSFRKITITSIICRTCGSVAEWLGCWTCDQQATGSNPGLPDVKCNPGQVVNTHICLPLSLSSRIWYQPVMPCSWEGNCRSGIAVAMQKTLVVLHLRAHGLGNGDEHPSTFS